MSHILRFLRVFVLGTWVGSILYFSIVVTPGAFATLHRDDAGALVGYTLGGLHYMGMIAAVIYLAAALAWGKSPRALARPAAIGVVLMLLLTICSQRIVIPWIDSLREQMGSVDATPSGNPLRVEFDRLHGVSVDLEAAALFLTVRRID